jgi:hypothetical protein
MQMSIDVDVVCCWVRLDRDYEVSLLQHKGAAKNKQAFSRGRYRDNGELLQSLKALDAFAPWVRTIHLVTNGQVPPTEVIRNPRVNLITHKDIFRDVGALPTFSYHAIEPNLCFIEGLSENYILTADDFFIGRPASLSDFMSDRQMPLVFLERTPFPKSAAMGKLWHQNLISSDTAISRIYGSSDRHAFAHTPFMFNRSFAEEVWRLWEPELKATVRQKFRSAEDVVFRMLYTYHVIHEKLGFDTVAEALASSGPVQIPRWNQYRAIKIGENGLDWRASLDEVVSSPPDFFCLQDHIAEDPVSEGEAYAQLGKFYADLAARYGSFLVEESITGT